MSKLKLSQYVSALILLFGITPTMADDVVSKDADKPIVAFVFDQEPACKKWNSEIRPIMAELQKKYGDRVVFAKLDASKSHVTESKEKAKKLGIQAAFLNVGDMIPMVLVFNAHKKLVKELFGAKSKSEYQTSIDKALAAE